MAVTPDDSALIGVLVDEGADRRAVGCDDFDHGLHAGGHSCRDVR
jgi:hypothetical protein